MRAYVPRLRRDQRAVTAVEHSLIVFLAGTAAIGDVTRVGQEVLNMPGHAANAMN